MVCVTKSNTIMLSPAPSKQGSATNKSLITEAPKVYTPTVAKSHNVLVKLSNAAEHLPRIAPRANMINDTTTGYTNKK